MTLLATFQKLGSSIENAWEGTGFKPDSFSSLAHEGLQCMPSIDIEELVGELLTADSLPTQFAIASDFGDPPITIYSSERFVIDLCFWVEPRTAIHSHNFAGAFKVLKGKSLHTTYHFEVEESDQDEVIVGKLDARSSELLDTGSVREIAAGPAFIHQVCHLTKPSLSIVARTSGLDTTGHVYSFHGPRLAVGQASAADGESRVRRTQLCRSMAAAGLPGHAQMIVGAAEGRSPAEQFELLLPLARTLTEGEWLEALERLGRGGPPWLGELRHYGTSSSRPVIHWSHVEREEHRLWLCLLLSKAAPTRVRELVQEFTGEDRFAETATTWTIECCELGAISFEVNPMACEVLRGYFEGLSIEQTADRLVECFNAPDLAQVLKDVQSFTVALGQAGLFNQFFPA